jgi:hypothetical protein
LAWAKSDLTIFVCGKKLFAFERDWSGLKGLDWCNQEDIFSSEQKWKLFSLTKNKVRPFQRSYVRSELIGASILGGQDRSWYFLEYNANGQFGFLDPKDEFGILDSVVEYLLKNPQLADQNSNY